MAANRGPAGEAYDDGDRRGRSRDRFRNRNRRRDRQAEPETVISEDGGLIPIAGHSLDVLDAQGYAFVRTTRYLPGPTTCTFPSPRCASTACARAVRVFVCTGDQVGLARLAVASTTMTKPLLPVMANPK